MTVVPRMAKGAGKSMFVGRLPEHVSPDIAFQIGERLQEVLLREKPAMKVLSLRALPTSVTEVADGIQFVANTVVAEGSRSPRSRTLDSVVTLGHKGSRWNLQQVKVPALGVTVDD